MSSGWPQQDYHAREARVHCTGKSSSEMTLRLYHLCDFLDITSRHDALLRPFAPARPLVSFPEPLTGILSMPCEPFPLRSGSEERGSSKKGNHLNTGNDSCVRGGQGGRGRWRLLPAISRSTGAKHAHYSIHYRKCETVKGEGKERAESLENKELHHAIQKYAEQIERRSRQDWESNYHLVYHVHLGAGPTEPHSFPFPFPLFTEIQEEEGWLGEQTSNETSFEHRIFLLTSISSGQHFYPL